MTAGEPTTAAVGGSREYRVVAVTNNFPTARFPEKGAFVLNNLREMARQGAAVHAVAPASWVQAVKTLGNAPQVVDHGPLKVSRPRMTTVPLRLVGGLRPRFMRLNDFAMERAIERAMRRGDADYDFCYAHFFPSARAASRPMRRRGIPVLLNLGESDPWDYDSQYAGLNWVDELSGYAGIVTVSRRNREYLLGRDPRLEARLRYIPNGVDTTRYRPVDRDECRARLGLPPRAKIAIFCGHFDERKGPLRVLAAVRQAGMSAVFLGSGSDRPVGPEVLFAGSVPAAAVPAWLNAADVFVLPTLSEGMSNAILEALACGLPVVVSDRDFNREYLTSECAEFVDPLDPDSIARGIARCLDAGNAASMSAAAARVAQQYSIRGRIQAMFAFVGEILAR